MEVLREIQTIKQKKKKCKFEQIIVFLVVIPLFQATMEYQSSFHSNKSKKIIHFVLKKFSRTKISV